MASLMDRNLDVIENHPAVHAGINWLTNELAPFIEGGLVEPMREAFIRLLTYSLAESLTGQSYVLRKELKFEGDQGFLLSFRGAPDLFLRKTARRLCLRFTDASHSLHLDVSIYANRVTGHNQKSDEVVIWSK